MSAPTHSCSAIVAGGGAAGCPSFHNELYATIDGREREMIELDDDAWQIPAMPATDRITSWLRRSRAHETAADILGGRPAATSRATSRGHRFATTTHEIDHTLGLD
jgi:hypothetical protein